MIAAPDAFKAYHQFILWQLTRDGRKVPIDRTLTIGNAHDPATHLDYHTAANTAALCGMGLAFVFTPADPFFFLDIDGARTGNQWSPLAEQLCKYFAGCAIEISQSGTGIHIFGTGPVPPHGCKNVKAGLEFYTEARFVALTGTGLTGGAAFKPPAGTLEWLVASYFPAGPAVDFTSSEWTAGPCLDWSGPEDDRELISRMLRSKSAAAVFGSRASISALWEADSDALAIAFPSHQSGDYPYDHSSADAALCAHLAFWTGKDCERIERLFQLSRLRREKWDNREDYRRRTILHATSRCTVVLGSPRPANSDPSPDSTEFRTDYQFMGVAQQQEHFKGCVYVRDLHRVLTPDGALLKPEQFRAMFGGYVFAIDAMNNKTTRSAWEAFTESQGTTFPKAFGACFRPELPSGLIIEEEGGSLVNIYTPAKVARKKGDPRRLTELLEKLLPNTRDRTILLSYMAACVQYIGVKFQWCPLLQGCQGNGKTLLLDCVANAIGWRYTHLPNPRDITNKFNSWILGKLFIGVEEVYVRDKQEAIEALKPLITNRRIEIHGKGQNQATGDNRANFIMCSNHKDAIRKTQTDRRYCVFYTAQQTKADMYAAGMTGDYFPKFYEWLRAGGHAVITEYLMTYEIHDEYNPAKGCHRAPVTTSTDEALMLSLGGLEQEILEAVGEGRYGFAGGWISSLALGQMISDRGDKRLITPNKRRQILQDLGYIPHPGLTGGRVNNIIPREAGKPILYVIQKHPSLLITAGTDVSKAYQKAQEST